VSAPSASSLSAEAVKANDASQRRDTHLPSRPIKVALVTSFPPSRGDLNEYGFHLARALRDDRRVELVILADEIETAQELGGFRVERCWRFDSMFNPLRLLLQISKHDPDVVWFNVGFSTFARSPVAAFLGIMTPLLTRLSGYYSHVTLHTVFERISLQDAGLRFQGLYRGAGKLATRLTLAANDVSVLLPSFRDDLKRNYGTAARNVEARPHGTFHDMAEDEPQQVTTLASEPVVLAFGYWGTYKRLELVLEAMENVRRQLPEATLVVAGASHPSTPTYIEDLREKWRARDLVKFAGYVAENELPELFRRAAILVLPYSSAAGTSGVVHQACQYGLPMVAAGIPEIVEIAKEERIAIEFYPPGDGQTLTEELVRLLKGPEIRERMARQNLLASRGTPMSQVVDGYIRLFVERTRARRGQVKSA
jgi:glycosyltransferase involved in cell wall biosynthesis